MKYSIEEIRDITDKAKVVNLKKLDKFINKKEKKENKRTIQFLKKVNKRIIKQAKKGENQCFCDIDRLNRNQRDIVLDYFETRLYTVKIDNCDVLIVCWEKV